MSRQKSLYSRRALEQWTREVGVAFPELSKPQAAGLASWSFGMVLAQSCALTAVALLLAELLKQGYHAVRQRLREFYLEADAKKGEQRCQLDVTLCFAPLLRWLLRDWQGRQLATALDASSLGDRFVVLCISVAYRGCAIPVAWKILPAAVKDPWKEHWLALLERFDELVPADFTVITLADRGLYAKWLFVALCDLGWHPLLRINQGGKFRPEGWHHFVPLSSLVPRLGCCYRGRGTAFATAAARLDCTLLACWEEGHAEAWLLLTDLPPAQSDAAWYGLRSWIEQFFKDAKRGGWQWQKTRMTEVSRAERLWLALAVATLWLVRVGGADEAAQQEAAALPELRLWTREGQPKTRRWRLVSVFARGYAVLVAALINHDPLPLGALIPEPWPGLPDHPQPAQARAPAPMVA